MIAPPTTHHVPASYYAQVATATRELLSQAPRASEPLSDTMESAFGMTPCAPGVKAQSMVGAHEYAIVRGILLARLRRITGA